MKTIKEQFDNAPDVMNNVFIKDSNIDTLILNVENNDRVLRPVQKKVIENWVWENEKMLKDEFGYLDIELNFIS